MVKDDTKMKTELTRANQGNEVQKTDLIIILTNHGLLASKKRKSKAEICSETLKSLRINNIGIYAIFKQGQMTTVEKTLNLQAMTSQHYHTMTFSKKKKGVPPHKFTIQKDWKNKQRVNLAKADLHKLRKEICQLIVADGFNPGHSQRPHFLISKSRTAQNQGLNSDPY